MVEIGNIYSRLTVIKDLGYKNHKKIVLAQCSCENKSLIEIRLNALKTGNTKSCGCLRPEIITKHGFSKHFLYGTWYGIIKRCNDKTYYKYKDYGARGIKVCNEWLLFENFINDMEPKYKKGLSVDRVDNNLGYSKENCRWATPKEQGRNKRSNFLISINNKSKCISEWSEILCVKEATIQKRILRNKPPFTSIELSRLDK